MPEFCEALVANSRTVDGPGLFCPRIMSVKKIKCQWRMLYSKLQSNRLDLPIVYFLLVPELTPKVLLSRTKLLFTYIFNIFIMIVLCFVIMYFIV